MHTLTEEDGLVWLEDVEKLDYVRPIFVGASTRAGRLPWRPSQGRLVGYTTVSENNTGVPNHFMRRAFYLHDHDRDSDPTGVYGRNNYPTEAVDPRTLGPKLAGEKTPRVIKENG